VIVMMRLLILIISMKMFITNTCRLRTYCIIILNIMLFSIMSYSLFIFNYVLCPRIDLSTVFNFR
jgi:hypothetical protein